jgi:uncharacterized protein
MYKKLILITFIVTSLAGTSLLVIARDGIVPEKEKEIRRMLQLTGMEKMMEQMKSQMITALRAQLNSVPDEFWTRFEKKMDINELVEKIVPLYDKYYSIEDIRAVNAFYSSEVGQRVIATLPKITKESTALGMEWGKRIGEEAEAEAKKKDAEK